MLDRKIKDICKSAARRIFETGQYFGLNILPCHFYSGIPDFRELRQNEYWKKARSMSGVNGIDTDAQFDFIESCCKDQFIERQKKGDIYSSCCEENGEAGFGPVEADFLFCFICSKRPQRIIQVGAGLATAVMRMAAEEAGYEPEMICIDPYPNEFIRKSGRENRIQLIPQKVQLIDLPTIMQRQENAFLFIDSAHTVKPGSDVNYLILEVLPSLSTGTWVHFHDIYFPYDYPRDIVAENLFFPNESALLHAFLIDNKKYILRASLGMLHYANPARLQKFLPNYRPSGNSQGLAVSKGHFPSSVYLQVIG
jgi:hypothetical protein